MTTSAIYPAMIEPRTLTRQVWDVRTARRIPGVGRALGLLTGLVSQMPLELYSGIVPLPRPRLLDDPDLDKIRALFVGLHVEDYVLQGNACHLVTARGADGWPAATAWFPANNWHVMVEDGRRRYWLNGREVSPYDVVHVQRGADPLNPARGIGVVEEYLDTFDRVKLQEASERETLTGGAVPSVAVIAPSDDDSTEEELDEQAERFEEKFSGPGRRPGIFPHGTTLTPLGWNPSDGQMVEARQLALTDVANMFNLDAYWLGAKASSHTYRSPGPLFLTLLRTTIEGILAPFEGVWSKAWVVRGKRVTFDRQAVLGDDFAAMVNALTSATGGPILTPNEGRARLQLGPVEGGDELRKSAVAQDPPSDEDPPDDPDAPDDEDTTQEGDDA